MGSCINNDSWTAWAFMWNLPLWTFIRIWLCDYIKGWIYISKCSFCEDMKTFSNRNIIIRSHYFFIRFVLKMPVSLHVFKCSPRILLVSNWLHKHFGHRLALLQAGASQPVKCFCKNFGCLDSLKQMFVCCSTWIKMLLCENTLLEKQMLVLVINIWTVGTLPLKILVWEIYI